MLTWRFNTYLSPTGRSDVQDAIDRYDDYGREYLHRQVAYLAVTGTADWTMPRALKLKGVKDLYEIRYKANRQQARALGFFGPNTGEFTITLICTHKDNVYKPPNAFQTATDRANSVKSGRASVIALRFDGEDFSTDDG